jgi:hypothetical protein
VIPAENQILAIDSVRKGQGPRRQERREEIVEQSRGNIPQDIVRLPEISAKCPAGFHNIFIIFNLDNFSFTAGRDFWHTNCSIRR